MIKIIKLVNGEQLIGDVQCVEKLGGFSYTVVNPMYIEREEGGMKLRDGLLLIDEESMSFRGADIITMSTPINHLELFYHKNVEYAIKYGRPHALAQIKEATADIEDIMQQDEKRKKKLVNILNTSNNVTSIH